MKRRYHFQTNPPYNTSNISVYEMSPSKRTLIVGKQEFHVLFPWTYFLIKYRLNNNGIYDLSEFRIFINEEPISSLSSLVYQLSFVEHIDEGVCLGDGISNSCKINLELNTLNKFFFSSFAENSCIYICQNSKNNNIYVSWTEWEQFGLNMNYPEYVKECMFSSGALKIAQSEPYNYQ